MAADPSSPEFRDIQVVAIELQRPLTIKLSLLAISAEAVKTFQEICRHIIRRENVDAKQLAKAGHMTEKEAQRLYSHIVTLQKAEVPLKRVVVKSRNDAKPQKSVTK